MAKSLGGAILRGVGGAIVGGATYKAGELMAEAKAARARSLEGFKQEGRMALQVAGDTAAMSRQTARDTALEGRAVSAFDRAQGAKVTDAAARVTAEQESYLLGKTREQTELKDKYEKFVSEGGTKGWSADKIKKHKASVLTGIPQPAIAKLRISDDLIKLANETVREAAPKGTPEEVILEDIAHMTIRLAKLGQTPLSKDDRYMGDVLSKENPTGTELPKPSQKLVTTVTRAKAGNYGAKQDLKKLMPDLIDELGREGAEALIDSIGEGGGMLDSAPTVKAGSTGDIIQPQPLGEDYAPYELYGSKGLGR